MRTRMMRLLAVGCLLATLGGEARALSGKVQRAEQLVSERTKLPTKVIRRALAAYVAAHVALPGGKTTVRLGPFNFGRARQKAEAKMRGVSYFAGQPLGVEPDPQFTQAMKVLVGSTPMKAVKTALQRNGAAPRQVFRNLTQGSTQQAAAFLEMTHVVTGWEAPLLKNYFSWLDR